MASSEGLVLVLLSIGTVVAVFWTLYRVRPRLRR